MSKTKLEDYFLDCKSKKLSPLKIAMFPQGDCFYFSVKNKNITEIKTYSFKD